jgi:hypothetical protein
MMNLRISPFFVEYIALWVSFCLIAGFILLMDRKRIWREWRAYFDFLFVPWKFYLFVPAFLFVTFAGRYTNDETWDSVTGSGMSIFTFLTAPWSVGLIYQVLVGRRPMRYLIVASAVLLFSSSWFYDAYLLWRDGIYTRRWLGNLMLSPIIYMAAGMLWNLEANESQSFLDRWDFRFSFVRPDWPSRPVDTRFTPVIVAAIPLILIAAFILVAFVGWNLVIPRP